MCDIEGTEVLEFDLDIDRLKEKIKSNEKSLQKQIDCAKRNVTYYHKRLEEEKEEVSSMEIRALIWKFLFWIMVFICFIEILYIIGYFK